MKTKEIILKSVAYLFILGGLVRVFATQSTFNTLRVGYFWVEDDYFKFTNRIMGGLIILTGLLFLGIARDLVRFKFVLGSFSLGLFFLSIIIGLSGYMLNIPSDYSYIADVALFGITGLFCLYIRA